jgi:hypothetical protein
LDTDSGGSSGWRSGDCHPLANFFFISPQRKRKKRGYTVSNMLSKSFFDHDRHSLTDFMNPPLDTDFSVRWNPEAPTVSVFVVYFFITIWKMLWTDDRQPFQVINRFEFGLYA